MVQRRRYLRILAILRKRARKAWSSNSGDWQWLAERPASIASLNRLLWQESVPSLSFFFMLTLSGVISTLGLLAGSTATVIGAMIIAPLMGPIIGIAYAIAIANRRLMKRAGITLILGTLATIISATLICQLAGLRSVTEEISLRTEPTLIDLFVAMAAGAAGAFAKSRRRIADAFPGVAIAVALVPPLSVIGIGMALWNRSIWLGATLLFITNLAGIIFSGILIFLWQEYGSLERAKRAIILSVSILFAIGIPLGFSLNNLLIQSTTRQQVRYIILQESALLKDARLSSVNVQRRNAVLAVSVELIAIPDSISEAQVRATQAMLIRELKRPVDLRVRVIPMQEFFAPSEIELDSNSQLFNRLC